MLKHPLLFGDHLLRATIDAEGATWWVFDDICAALSLEDTPDIYSEVSTRYKKWVLLPNPIGREKILLIHDLGLYQILLQSRIGNNPSFQRFIAKEIFPCVLKAFN